ncbi:TetR/AcrR family transcriptional regulator [Streptomyces sp. NPDC001922]|uniref:TetR/AcrR family transcriptional regulator n=1 Tax=Streptomyces sp. NPDC001922 TaxID=3364624 RepID=UPI0036C6891F
MIRMVSARTAVSPSGAPVAQLGLRERKKIRTRQAIRRAACRLFEEKGYDATPVERIAEAAEVSLSTVFRYFPTKEDIVLTDEYDPLLESALRARPEDEPPLTSVRHVVVGTLRLLLADRREEVVLRAGLVLRVPALRARMWERQADTARLLCRILAERTGRPADDLDLRVFAAAVLGALHETLLHWAEGGLDGNLEDVMDHTMTALTHGFTV